MMRGLLPIDLQQMVQRYKDLSVLVKNAMDAGRGATLEELAREVCSRVLCCCCLACRDPGRLNVCALG